MPILLVVAKLLVCVWVTRHSLASASISVNESQSLLSVDWHSYQQALKETLPLLAYPVITIFLIVSFNLIDTGVPSPFWLTLLHSISEMSGFLSALAFTIYLLVLGKEKRAVLRKRGQRRIDHQIQPSSPEDTRCNENGAIQYTAAQSITVTHPTEFKPPTENEVVD